MSGGYFDYKQYEIDGIIRSIRKVIAKNDSNEKDEFGYVIGSHYSVETIKKLQETVNTLARAATMAQRVDYLLEGDDNEESFRERWDEELNEKGVMK